ncbi:hypothetical protein B0H14DRAFT_3600900 [Mycena olivaceomarginata]|nr:hypothetical protein B0H14DRAFT_3600900 [Mycena olivaceomarginata]
MSSRIFFGLQLALSYFHFYSPTHTIDDTNPLVDYYQGLHCSPCPDEFKNYGLDPAQLSNGTFSAFENNGGNFVGTQDNGLRLRFNGTAIYVYLAVPAAANLSTPVHCSFILDSVPDAGGDFSMNGPPVVNQYNVLAYAKTDIPDGSHILNMDVGDTPVVFDYAYYTSNNLEPDSPAPSAASNSGSTVAISFLVTSSAASKSAAALTSSPPFPLTSASTSAATIISVSAMTSSPAILPPSSTSAATMTSAAATTSSATIFTSSSPKKTLSIPLIAGAAAVGVALILAMFVGFMLYHRARRTKADAPGTEEWGFMQQDQSRNEVSLRQLRNELKRLEGTSNGTGSDIASLVSTSMEGSSAKGSESASRTRFAFHDEEGPDARSAGS